MMSRSPVQATTPPFRSPIEELIAKQGVKPADDLDVLSTLWPVDDDPDAFDAFVREQRKTRRFAAR